jgi:hypothetical protein
MTKLQEEIARLIAEHGYKAVEEEIKKARPTPKRGRPHIDDAIILRPQIEHDAMCWLLGHNTFSSNNAVADEVAEIEPGHSSEATNRRIRRKFSSNGRLREVLGFLSDPENAQRIVEKYAPASVAIEARASAVGVTLPLCASDDELAACIAEIARKTLSML